jgi:AcrR family transcriptional regulator
VTVQESRRERKKRRTREAIVAAAFTLFAARGFEAVTVTEIAELADVARATLFSYFPTKESIALGVVGDDDPADIVASRSPGVTPLDALRRHYRAFAAGGVTDAVTGPADDGPGAAGPPGPDLLTCVRVIAESPALTAGAGRLLDGQRAKLAGVLAAEAGDAGLWPELAAAQICAAISAVKSGFLGRLAAGEPFARVAERLPGEVELAFDLLEHGLGGEWPPTLPGRSDDERRDDSAL